MTLALAAAVGGCATPAPDPEPAAGLAIPEDWTAEAPGASGPPIDDTWWRAFDEPRLAQVIEQALEANPDLALAAARIRQAEAQARIAGADRYPQADASVSAARQRQNLIGFPIPGGASFTTSTFGVSLNASWEIDLWERLGAQARAAEAAAQAARAEFAAARLSLAGQAAKGYFALVESGRQLELAQTTLELRSQIVERVRRRYEAGLVAPLDLRLALSSEAAAAALAASRAGALDRARRSLEALIGRYPRGALEAAETLPEPQAHPEAGVPSRLLTRRADIVAAERRVAAAGARVEAARAALYPQLRLTGALGRRAGDVGGLFDPAFTVWSLAADLLAPLFQAGRLRAQVDLAQAALAEALASYRDTLIGAFAEAETALAADRYLAEQVDAARRQLEQAEAATRLAAERYGLGLVDLLTVLEAERQRLEAASQLLAARRERLQARTDLYLALGGGFDAR